MTAAFYVSDSLLHMCSNSSFCHNVLILLSLSGVTNLLLAGVCAACMLAYRCLQMKWWAWRVLSNKVIWALGHCWVDIPHIYTHEWDCLFFFQSCLLSTVTVTPSDSDYVNRSASLELNILHITSTIASTILCIRTTGCMRSRQSPYEMLETVATRVVTGIRHWIV